MPRIKIETGSISLEADLNDGPTAKKIYDALPISARANTWGDEIYFSTSVDAGPESKASDVLPAGSIAFWPPGNAFCIIWGPTPASHGDECRFASPVNPLGSVDGDASQFGKVLDGDQIKITAV